MSAAIGQALYREFFTQEEIDKEYDPAHRCSDLSAIRQAYEHQAERARADLTYIENVRYGPTVDEHVDIFPASEPNAPVAIFLHGGYWRAFHARDFSQVALGLNALGMTVVVVNYSLCPKVSIDEITRQVRASIFWTICHASSYNGDGKRVALVGHSAGAHLAAMCLQTRWTEEYGLEENPISVAAMISGVYDITPLKYSYLQAKIQLDEGVIRRNSPLFTIRKSTAKLLLAWGDRESEEFSRQSLQFYLGWLRAGNSADCLSLKNEDHFSILQGLESSGSQLCRWLANAI